MLILSIFDTEAELRGYAGQAALSACGFAVRRRDAARGGEGDLSARGRLFIARVDLLLRPWAARSRYPNFDERRAGADGTRSIEVAAAAAVLPCCGSRAWAAELAARRPIADEAALIAALVRGVAGAAGGGWQEAFDSHPRIGEQKAQGRRRMSR